MSDPRSYDRARIDRWKLAEAAAQDNGKCGQPSPKPPGGAPRGERTGLEPVRYTPRKRGQTRLASAIVECAFSALRPPLHRGGQTEGCEARQSRRATERCCVWLFEIVRGQKN